MKVQNPTIFRLFYFLAALSLLVTGCAPASINHADRSESNRILTHDPDGTLDPLKEFIKGFAERQQVPGIGILIARRGKIILWEAYGYADVDFEKPFRKDTIVFLASSTKPLTTTAILTLVDEGRIDLDEPVSTYLAEFRDLRDKSGNPVPAPTLRHLLSHTSGWAGLKEMSPDATMAVRDQDIDLKESALKIAREPLLEKPGSRFSYGGLSFNVAGRIAEVVSGQTFDTLIKERLFDPLKMKDTRFHPSSEQGNRIAGIFKPAPWGGQLNLLRYDADREKRLLLIGGGLYSTASDLAVFLQMHLNGGQYGDARILSEDMIFEMQKHQIGDARLGYVPLESVTSYGLGWIREMPKSSGSQTRLSHAGAFGSVIWIDTERDLLGVIFTPMPLKFAHPIHQQIRTRIQAAIQR